MFPLPRLVTGLWQCWSSEKPSFFCQTWLLGPQGMRGERCKEAVGVQTGAQELWQEMLGRRKVEWCWELEERRREKKSALRPRPATGRGSGAQRAKLWRGGEVRRVWGVRSTLLGERTFLRCQLIARSPVPLCRAPLSSLLSFCPETGAWGLPCTP